MNSFQYNAAARVYVPVADVKAEAQGRAAAHEPPATNPAPQVGALHPLQTCLTLVAAPRGEMSVLRQLFLGHFSMDRVKAVLSWTL